ncbi:MAG TPA: branched-chain amino acid ABC transporter ATP-binding protein/permease, partial [Acidimicrobiales bacterium]|nr:branched-chain amino acid ABC transporter ATP-binding protein/permease [Acidimicrobiales bacterium]
TLRVGGFYLGLVTLFMALMIPVVASHLTVAGKSSGLSLATVPAFVQHPKGVALYQIGIGILAVLAGYSWLIKQSRLGRRLGALMASEDLAQSVGIVPYWSKLVSFLLAAVPCGLGGAFYVYSQQFISPGSVSPTLSIYILAGLVIGGGGTIIGPMIGTALVGAASQFLGSFNKYQGIVYGVALIGVAAGLPTGLVGMYHTVVYRFFPPRAAPPVPEVDVVTEAAAMSGLPPSLAVVREPRPAAERQLLSIRGARRSFGGVRAIDGVDLDVSERRIHALVGPNGSGKTTLLNLICGFYRLDAGEISLGDTRLDGLRAAEVAKLGIARTFQTPKLLIGDTALANVLVGADRTAEGSLVGAVLHTRRSRQAQRVGIAQSHEALGDVGLLEASAGIAAVMPHGTQRLLEIARAVALQPTFLLLDEPAAGLSLGEVEVLKGAVRQLAQNGLGVLLVEHNLPVVFDLADEVTVLHQGQVIAHGTPAEVSADPKVVRVYLGRQRLEGDVPTTAKGLA